MMVFSEAALGFTLCIVFLLRCVSISLLGLALEGYSVAISCVMTSVSLTGAFPFGILSRSFSCTHVVWTDRRESPK